ncbi:MAG: sigma-70 family RNA polymerase sigma factor [Chloroflexota bacterium]
MTPNSMETIVPFFSQAQAGDSDAYGIVVQQFQGMAVSYAYGILNDYQLAEDAAQEAFLEAYVNLAKVYSVNAFPSWLRKIIFKHCDRLTRGKQIKTVDLTVATHVASDRKGPTTVAEDADTIETVRKAVEALPEHERTVVLLFYLAQHSHKEIATFLEVQVSTVKNRLHTARNRMRAWLLDTMDETLPNHIPLILNKEAFAMTIVEIIQATEKGDLSQLNTLLERHPNLAKAKDERPGATALHYAAWSGQMAAAELLLDYGADIDLHDDTHTAPPIGWAGENGQTAMFAFLYEKGAKLTVGQAAAYGTLALVQSIIEADPRLIDDGVAEKSLVWSPLWQAAFWRRDDIFAYLLAQGADVNGKTRRGESPLHGAVGGGQLDIIKQLLAAGGAVNAKADCDRTPLHIAAWHRYPAVAQLLLDHGADVNARDQHGHTPLSLANVKDNVTGWDVVGWGHASEPDEALIQLFQKAGAKI